MKLTRVIARLEPGGPLLGVLRITPALRRLGIETRLLAGHASREARRMCAAARVELESWPRGDAHLAHEPRAAFADWLVPRLADADLVHGHMLGGWWAAAHAAPAGTPLVASEHGAVPAPPHDAMRAALERVDLVFAHGPLARALFAELGVEPSRLRAGASAIDGIDAGPLRDLPSPRLVFAGRLHAEKGPDLLLRALALIPDAPPAFVLGSGPLDRRLRRMARRLGLDGHVRFTGWRPDAARFLAGAAACVVPSRHAAWSQTAVQAMGLGVPVVATAVEGLPATLGSSRGVLVPPEDPEALAAAIEGVLCGEMPVDRQDARSYAQRFLPDRVARAYADEYLRLLTGEAPRAAAEAA